MEVLHVVPTYWPATRYGGPIYSVHGLCAALVAQGISVTVYTTSVDGKENSDVEHQRAYFKDGVRILYFESKVLRRIYYSSQLRQALVEQMSQFDLLHLHSIFLYPTNIAARIAVSNRVPYVLAPRGMLEKSLIQNKSSLVKSLWLKLFEQKTIEQADLLHLTSQRELSELKSFNYDFPPTTVIANGIDQVPNIERSPKDRDTFHVLFLGRINWKKQIDHLLKALPLLDFKAKVTIAGNDEEAYKHDLNQLIVDLKLLENNQIEIVFPGEVKGKRKQSLFLDADVMVLPSKSENFGNTVIEAMAYGCPVIVTPEVGASEVVSKAQAGLITDGSPESIAQCIKEIRNDKQQAEKMSANAVNEIEQNYLWPKIALKMIKAYQGVIQKNA